MMHRALRSYRPSLRLSLGCLLVALVALTAGALGLAAYASARDAVFEGIRERLRDAVSVGALMVDADAHRRIQSPADEQMAEYKALRATLQRIRDQCGQVRFVYTLRRGGDGQYLFVVDAEEDPGEVSHVGDVYDGQFDEAMGAAFTPPYRVHVAHSLTTDEWGVWLSSYAPLFTRAGEFEGVLAMDMSAESIRRYQRHCLLGLAAVAAVVCVLAIALALALAHGISRPLLVLAKDMDNIQHLRLDRYVPVHSRIREVHEMALAVHTMKVGLRSFRRYVPADLVSELIRLGQDAVPGGERRCITIFFSDIRGFTAIAEQLPPETLAAGLSAYFRAMTGTILEHHGTVDKFIGDGIMAFWGAPTPVADHALLACRAALACQVRLTDLNQEWSRQGLPPLVTRIGLHTGEAIVGNTGYEERLNYTAIGDAVNLASRAEGINKHYGTLVLVTGDTRRLTGDGLVTRWLDRIAVKGRAGAVDIYELLAEAGSETPEQARIAGAANRGMERYLQGDWDAAGAAFAAVQALVPGDVASALMVERCRAFAAHPPPGGWDGVTVMTEK